MTSLCLASHQLFLLGIITPYMFSFTSNFSSTFMNQMDKTYYMKNQILLLCTHTHIIGHYNPSVRIIDLVSHTTYVVCVNFMHKWRDLQFKVDPERQIFLRKFSWHSYLLSEYLPEICWEKIAEEILFVFPWLFV